MQFYILTKSANSSNIDDTKGHAFLLNAWGAKTGVGMGVKSGCVLGLVGCVWLGFGGAAQAWPFVKKTTTGILGTGVQPHASVWDINNDGRLEIYGGGLHVMHSPANAFTALPSASAGADYYTGLIHDNDQDGNPDYLSLTRGPPQSGIHHFALRRYDGQSNGSMHPDADNFDNIRGIWNAPANAIMRMVSANVYGGRGRIAMISMSAKFDHLPGYVSIIKGIFMPSMFDYRWIDNLVLDDTVSYDPTGSHRITCLVAADFNNDGKEDVLAGDAAQNILRLYDNLGDGNFTPMQNMGSVTNPRELVAADVDGDGRVDIIIVAGSATRTISWRRNIGGAFAATDTIVASSATAEFGCPAMIDLDDDGDDDIVFTQTVGAAAEVRYCLWNGSSFSAPATLDTVNGIGPIAVADADGDGDPDFWVIAGSSYHFFENVAAHAAMRWTTQLWGGANPSGVTHLATGDLNGDSWTDLLCAAEGGKHIRWYPGGSNGLQAPLTINTFGHAPADLTVGDFDLDGNLDVAYTVPTQTVPPSVGPGAVRIARNTLGLGAIWQDAVVLTGVPVTSLQMFNRNFNDDRAPDLIASAPSVPWLGMLLNGGNGISWSAQIPPGRPDPYYRAIGIGRRSMDHIAAIRHGGNLLNNQAHLLEAFDPNSPYNAQTWKPPLTDTDLESHAITRGDVDAESGVEYILAAGTRRIYATHPLQYGNMPGAFIGTAPGTVRQLSVVDWDRDGGLEVLSASGGGVHLYARENGSWATNAIIPEGDFRGVVPIRLNGDARMDAVAVAASGQLHLIQNTSVQTSLSQWTPYGVDGVVGLSPGTEEPVLALTLRNWGRTASVAHQSHDASIGIATLRVRFLHAVLSGRSYVAGSTMTTAEITNLLEGVTFYRDLGTPGVLDPADIPMAATPLLEPAVNGFVSIDLSPAAKTAQALTALETTGNWIIGLRAKSTAGSAGIPRFFLYHYGTGSASSVIDYSSGPGLRPLDREADAFSVRALVELGNLAFTSNVYHVTEGPGAVVHGVVKRRGPTNNTVTVQYATTPGTATNGTDYSTAAGTLTIPAGQTEGVIPITILNNNVYEPVETFTIELFNPGAGGVLHFPSEATIVITDDEPMPAVSVATPAPITEGHSGSAGLTFNVSLNRSSAITTTVWYATQNITATHPSDYTAVQGVLIFEPLQTLKTVTVQVHGDTDVEPNETFRLNLHSPTNATLGTAFGTGTILDDDGLGVFEFSQANFNVPEWEETVMLTVTRSGNLNGEATVLFNYDGGTATPDEDFRLFGTSGFLSFPAAASQRTIMVTIYDDFNVEGPETVRFRLHTPSAGTIIGTQSNATLTILDDEVPSVVAGRIARLDGSALAGLDVRLAGIAQVSTVTDAEGNFQLVVPVYGAGYTLAVDSDDWMFLPGQRHYTSITGSLASQDFLAVTPPPVLRMKPFDAERVELFWPVTANDWTLMRKRALTDDDWDPVADEPFPTAQWQHVLRSTSVTQEFYQLNIVFP